MTISFFVPGTPKPQPRPRAFSRGGVARVYDPATAEGWKSLIATEARKVRPSEPLPGPLTLEVQFTLPRPKSHYTSKGALREAHNSAYHTQKPDLDNLAKAVMDAMTVIGFWRDDAEIQRLTLLKWWSSDTMPAGAYIRVVTL